MKKAACVFTIVQDESFFLRLWFEHYLQHFDATDLFVIDHNSIEPVQVPEGVNVIRLEYETSWAHDWLCETVENFNRFLLGTYETVLFAEADEYYIANPLLTSAAKLPEVLNAEHIAKKPVLRSQGFDIVQMVNEDPPVDPSKPMLGQRQLMFASDAYCKPCAVRVPVRWNYGFHTLRSRDMVTFVPELVLCHFHYFDEDILNERNALRLERKWCEKALYDNLGKQNRNSCTEVRKEFLEWKKKRTIMRPIPDEWKSLIPALR